MRATVLVVDDEREFLHGPVRTLRGTEFAVITAEGTWSGVDALRRDRFEVVLADRWMPGMTGLELPGVVRQRPPGAVRILMSGRADLETALEAISSGEVFRFLTRPFESTELLLALGRASGRERPAPPR